MVASTPTGMPSVTTAVFAVLTQLTVKLPNGVNVQASTEVKGPVRPDSEMETFSKARDVI